MSRNILLGSKLRSLESAAEEESNVLLSVQHQSAAESLRHRLWDQREPIAALVRHHLRLRRDDVCRVLPPDSWIQGGFNLCILVEVDSSGLTRRLVFRCPMPHKLAENQYPGTIDEKVSCEVATYVWMQEYCAGIRIPDLYAFGFGDGSHFTHAKQRPFYSRICDTFWHWIYRLLRYPLLSSYTRNTSAPAVGTAYMLLEYVGPETGKMLSLTWAHHMHDAVRRARLFRGMARIMLSLARLPQPHIGSFRFNTSDCTVTLSNRPLTCTMMLFENSGTPRTVQPRQLYQSTDSFASDMLTLHDTHLLHDPHAVRNEGDAQERMTIRTFLRAVMHFFILPDRRSGPFLLQLTDFHQSNIFVDDDWNITCLIDLEWVCALPVEMLSVPYWLTNCSIDGIIDEEYGPFDEARQAFLTIMDEEVKSMQLEHDIQITRTMRDVWVSKGVWFWACIRSLNAWLFVFEDHILPKFSANKELVIDLKEVSTFWQEGAGLLIKAKVADEERYQAQLRSLFNSRGLQ
ncbi:Fc.00g045390.m01.CDS01 [Cosmosporella sp. VM-42]